MQVIARGLLLTLVAVLVACTAAGTKEPVAKEAGTKAPATEKPVAGALAENHIEGFFVVPELDLVRYRKIILNELQLDKIFVRQPASMPKSKSWELTDVQKRVFRERYIGAAVAYLIADGAYATAIYPDDDVLLLQASVVQIIPFNSIDQGDALSASMQSGAEGMGTVVIELFDSRSGELLASLTDSYNFGRIWEENNLLVNPAPIHNAFDFWLRYLRQEMDALTKH